MERKLRYIENRVKKEEIEFPEVEITNAPNPKEIINLEVNNPK